MGKMSPLSSASDHSRLKGLIGKCVSVCGCACGMCVGVCGMCVQNVIVQHIIISTQELPRLCVYMWHRPFKT